MKILTIAGTRPDLIKLSQIIKKFDQHVEHVFVHTGQNYDPQLSEVFYTDLGLRKPDVQLWWHGHNLATQLANNFADVNDVLENERPDAVVILGDTNSTIAGSYLAKRMKIPLFHLEAGNRCFDDNVPEEINRRIIDHISDVNLAYAENARRNLLDEGVAKERIFIMGSPMAEVLQAQINSIKASTVLDELKLEVGKYFLVSIHRDENTEIPENLEVLLDTIEELATKNKVIVSTHPRLEKKIGDKAIPNVQFHKPFGFLDYCQLQLNAKCVVSDSGTVAEESALLGFPAVTVRNAMERLEAIDAGSIILTGVDKENILKCIELAQTPTTVPADYTTTNCSDRVLKVVLGFTPSVNKYVWQK